MSTTVAETGKIGRSMALGAVLLLHGLVIAAFLSLHGERAAEILQREIQIRLLPLRKVKPVRIAPAVAGKPKKHNVPAIESTIRALASVPVVPEASLPLQGVGASLNCGTQLAGSSQARRKPCAYPAWRYNPADTRSFTLNEPPPAHKWSQPEIDRYVMRTADPCLAEKAAHLQFCVHEIIYGATTIPDPSKAQPSGLNIGGLNIFGDH